MTSLAQRPDCAPPHDLARTENQKLCVSAAVFAPSGAPVMAQPHQAIAAPDTALHVTMQALHDCIEGWLPVAITRFLCSLRLPEDIIQEAVLHTYRVGRRMIWGDLRKRYKLDQKPLEECRAILLAVARHKAQDLMRPRKRRITEVFLPADDVLASGELDPAVALEDELIWKALRKLRNADQELIGARFVEDLSMRKCAKHFGIPEATFRRRLHRALMKLKAVYIRLARE